MIKEKYEQNSLKIINESQILTKEDFDIVSNLKEELKDVFLHSQVFRTRTEMEVSVLNDVKFPTADSKYWQSVREQNVMFHELVMLSYDYRKNIVEVKKLQRKLKKEKDLLEKELLLIELDKTQFILKNQERTAKDRIREIKEWHQIKTKLLPNMKYSTKDVNEHQLFSYAKRFINQVKVAGNNGSPAENQNLYGQLMTTLTTIKEKGLTEKFIATLPEGERAQATENMKLLTCEVEDA